MTSPANPFGFTMRSWSRMKVCIWLSVVAGGMTVLVSRLLRVETEVIGSSATVSALLAAFLSF